jgi:amino acid transporter
MQLCIALGMAELASAYPTSGGMYYWQFRLAGRRVGPFACWITGVCCAVLCRTVLCSAMRSVFVVLLHCGISQFASYWQFRLAGRRVGPFACWITGVCCAVLCHAVYASAVLV